MVLEIALNGKPNWLNWGESGTLFFRKLLAGKELSGLGIDGLED